MGGSATQQVAYAVTLLRDSVHEWFIAYERRNRGMPRDWAQLSTALLERFGSNIRSQEAQSQLMSISQGTRPVREYASQFEMLLGRLDSYDKAMLLNQFVWGLQPELARSVSLHYPKSIAQAVSLAETPELAVKASRRPGMHSQKSGRAPSALSWFPFSTCTNELIGEDLCAECGAVIERSGIWELLLCD